MLLLQRHNEADRFEAPFFAFWLLSSCGCLKCLACFFFLLETQIATHVLFIPSLDEKRILTIPGPYYASVCLYYGTLLRQP